MKTSLIPIIDTGHGSNTPGKRSLFSFEPNGKVTLMENNFNEAVGNKMSLLYYLSRQECHFITNEWWDVPLEERCDRENKIAREIRNRGERSIFISIHADAFGETERDGNLATGATFFYKSEEGRRLAEHFTRVFKEGGYPLKIRTPKYANYKVLRSTTSPALLFEGGFMTNNNVDLPEILKDSTRNLAAVLLKRAIDSYLV